MQTTLNCLASAITGILLLLASPPAEAGSIRIDFDLTGSFVSLLGGILEIPPDGDITTATARITVTGSDLTSPDAGDVQLSNLQLAATIDGTVGESVLITGDFTASQIAGGKGSLANDLTTLSLVSLTLNLDGTIDCIGGLCAALGTFPASVMNSPVEPSGLEAFAIEGLDTLGTGTLSGVLPFYLGGNEVFATLVGQETGRTFLVPEPAANLSITASLLTLSWLRARRKKRLA